MNHPTKRIISDDLTKVNETNALLTQLSTNEYFPVEPDADTVELIPMWITDAKVEKLRVLG